MYSKSELVSSSDQSKSIISLTMNPDHVLLPKAREAVETGGKTKQNKRIFIVADLINTISGITN